jgi:lysophospholipase L1-like esterase
VTVPSSALLAGVLLGVGVGFIQATRVAAPTPTPSPWPGTVPDFRRGAWMDRHESFVAEARKGGIDLLFVGDSITDSWRGTGRAVWNERFAPLKAANFGLSGDRTQHLLWRLQNGELAGLQPRAVVVLIGTNNIGQKDPETPASAIAGIGAVVAELRQRLPRARILLLGIFPRGEKPDDPLRGQIKEINAAAARLADGRAVTFLDVAGAFLDQGGTISREIMPDHLHLSAKGYERWANAIREPVARLLK